MMKVLLPTFSATLCYTGYVEYHRREHDTATDAILAKLKNTLAHRNSLDSSRTKPKLQMGSDSYFGNGSADEIVKDNLKPGDIVLFSRRWYHHHLLMALEIKIYQMLNNTEYDHCGVIVQDDYGNPYVYEKTPFSGYRMTAYDERIIRSRAHQICLLPLLPRVDSVDKRSRLHAYTVSTISDHATAASSLQQLKQMYHNIITSEFAEMIVRSTTMNLMSADPNIDLMSTCYSTMDIQVSSEYNASAVDIINNKLSLSVNKSGSVGDAPAATEACRLGQIILIRTK